MRRSWRISWAERLAAAALGAALCGPASAQAIVGQWTHGQVFNEATQGDPGFASRCIILNSLEIQLDIAAAGDGDHDGSMVQDRRITIIGDAAGQARGRPAVEAACGLKNAKDPLMGAQIKAWMLSGEKDGAALEAASTSAECRRDWCTAGEPRFASVKPGAAPFDTRFELRGGLLYDTMGTPAPADDMVFLPRVKFETRSNEGAAVALRFIKALASNRPGDVLGLLYVGPAARGMTAQQAREGAAWFAANASDVAAYQTVEQRLGTSGDRGKDVWAVRLRMQRASGATLDAEVFVWAEPDGAPHIGGWRTY